MANKITPNLEELGKVVRAMQDESLNRHKVANNFNQAAATIVQQGVDDKMRSRGWPVGTRPPVDEKTGKKML